MGSWVLWRCNRRACLLRPGLRRAELTYLMNTTPRLVAGYPGCVSLQIESKSQPHGCTSSSPPWLCNTLLPPIPISHTTTVTVLLRSRGPLPYLAESEVSRHQPHSWYSSETRGPQCAWPGASGQGLYSPAPGEEALISRTYWPGPKSPWEEAF